MAQVIGWVLAAAAGLLLLAQVTGTFEEGVADTHEGDTDALITRLRANVAVVFANQADLGSNTDLVPTLIDVDKVPSSALNAAGNGILHPYGGAVTILGDDERIGMTLAGLDDDQCARAATKLVGGRGVVNIQVATAAPTAVFTGTEQTLTVSGVASACDEGDGANFLTVTFR